MKIRKTLSALVLLFALSVSCFADGKGTTAGFLLANPAGVQAEGMGQAFAAAGGDIFGLNYNPALPALLKRSEAAIYYKRGIAEDNYGSAAFSTQLKSLTVGCNLTYYDAGSMDMINSSGIAAQFTSTNGLFDLKLFMWMLCASKSLPTPFSPVIRTVPLVGAT